MVKKVIFTIVLVGGLSWFFPVLAAPGLSALPPDGSTVQIGSVIDYSWNPVSTRENCINFRLPTGNWSGWICLGARIGSYSENTGNLLVGQLSAQVATKRCSFLGLICSWDYSNVASHDLFLAPSSPPPPTQQVTADIKINGSDQNVTVTSGSTVDVTWSSTNAGSCTITPCTLSFPNTCNSTNGEEIVVVTNPTDFSATCFAPDGSEVSQPDTIKVNIGQPKNNPPVVTALNPQSPINYCANPLGWILSWNFSDPDANSFQSAYQISINDAATGRAVLSRLYYSSSNSFAVTAGALAFNKTYSWKIKVWDNNLATAETTGPNFATLPHSPPVVDFNWQPMRPSTNQKVDFFDTTLFYDRVPAARSWQWILPAGIQALSSTDTYNLSAKAERSANYDVVLNSTDSENLTCAKTKSISVGRAVPRIKEIFPR